MGEQTNQTQVGANGRQVEWPTWLLIAVIYGGWIVTVTFYASYSNWALQGLLIVLCAWYMSLQHELVHGHPTKYKALNRYLGLIPLTVWYPYDLYRDSHLKHHNDRDLTIPGVDPEGNYLFRDSFENLPAPLRWIMWASRTFVGRLLFGPAVAIAALFKHVLLSPSTWKNPKSRISWLQHLLLLALMLWGLAKWSDISPVLYLFGVAYPALGLAMLRSFYEHRPALLPAQRIVINEAAWPWRLLYLNNNYHSVHHEHPGLPWYQIPEAYRADKDGYLERNGGFHVPGYTHLLLKNGFKPIDSPVFPTQDFSAGA
jgi:fatty acid desaturase